MIVDTHVHIWEMPPVAPVGPTAPRLSAVPTESGTAELLLEDMDAHGVDWTVLVQTSWSTWDNGYVADCARKYPDRFVAHGLVDPIDPDNAATAAYWMDERGMVGFRFHPMYYRVDDPAEGRILMRPDNEAMFAAISDRGGIIQIHSEAGHADQLDFAAARYPGVTWLIDHMMYPQPQWAATDWAPYQPVLALARHPNVYMKISDVHNRSGEDFPHRDMHELVNGRSTPSALTAACGGRATRGTIAPSTTGRRWTESCGSCGRPSIGSRTLNDRRSSATTPLAYGS